MTPFDILSVFSVHGAYARPPLLTSSTSLANPQPPPPHPVLPSLHPHSPTDMSSYFLTFNGRLGRLVLDYELQQLGLMLQPQQPAAATAATAAAPAAAGEAGGAAAAARQRPIKRILVGHSLGGACAALEVSPLLHCARRAGGSTAPPLRPPSNPGRLVTPTVGQHLATHTAALGNNATCT